MDIKIFVAAHKACSLPQEDVYIPIQVGAKGKAPITCDSCGIKNASGNLLRDDDGENISEKNPYYCELTGVYYIWKNIEADVVGLCHYRRYFTAKKKMRRKEDYNPFEHILQRDDIVTLIENCDVIIPKNNKYYIETLYSHYAHTHDGEHLQVARDIIRRDYPEYLKYLDQVYSKTNGAMYNMNIMKKSLFDEYCQWVFDILGKMEESIDTAELSDFSARLFGRVSELLFNVWILKKQEEDKIVVKEVPVVYTAQVDWAKKIYWFIQAKFFGKKYSKSA